MGIIHEAWLTLASGSVQRIPDPRAKRAEMEAGPGFEGYIGLDSVDITPRDLLPLNYWGTLEDCRAEGFLGRLFAYCLTLRKTRTDKPLVLITLDLGPWPSPAFANSLVEDLRRQFGLPVANLMVQTTGVLSSPDLEECRIEGDSPLPAYLSLLRESVAQLVKKTIKGAKWGVLEFTKSTCHMATNCDASIEGETEEAMSRWVIGARSGAPADHTMLVGRVARTDGTSGTLVNYACWPATLAPWARHITPDFPGSARELVERETGGPCMFLQGLGADQCPAFAFTRNQHVVEKNGRELGHAVLSALSGLPPAGKRLVNVHESASDPPMLSTTLEDATLASGLSARAVVAWPEMRVAAITEAERVQAIEEGLETGDINASLSRMRLDTPVQNEVKQNGFTSWLWQTGGVAFVGVPASPHTVLQHAIRHGVRRLPVLCLSNVNGSFGPMPPHHLYREDMPSVRSTPFVCGALERVRDVIIDNLVRW